MSKNQSIRATLFFVLVVFWSGLGTPIQASAPASISIPCGDSAALIAAVNAANQSTEPDTMHLAPNCVYSFNEAAYIGVYGISALPEITAPLAIYGHGATLQRSDPETTEGFRFITYTATSGPLIIDRLTMQDGYASQNGGAIFSAGPIEISRSTFRNNKAFNGGALYLENVAQIDGSLFTNNQAGNFGGAIALWIEFPTGSNALQVTNTTFTQNIALDGFALTTNDATLLKHNTIVGNSELLIERPNPAAVTNKGTVEVTLSNTILYNTPNDCSGLVLDLGGNLQAGTSCDVEGLNTNPMLSPLQDNGGPTHTMALQPASPAVEHGSVAQCTLVDQRGAPRDSQRNCDAGAYETGGMINGQIQVEPGSILAGQTTAVKITLSNHLGKDATMLALDGRLPDGLAIQEFLSSSCQGDFSTDISGTHFGLSDGVLSTDQSCSLEFRIVATLPGQYVLNGGRIHSNEGGVTDLYSEAGLVVGEVEPQKSYIFLPVLRR